MLKSAGDMHTTPKRFCVLLSVLDGQAKPLPNVCLRFLQDLQCDTVELSTASDIAKELDACEKRFATVIITGPKDVIYSALFRSGCGSDSPTLALDTFDPANLVVRVRNAYLISNDLDAVKAFENIVRDILEAGLELGTVIKKYLHFKCARRTAECSLGQLQGRFEAQRILLKIREERYGPDVQTVTVSLEGNQFQDLLDCDRTIKEGCLEKFLSFEHVDYKHDLGQWQAFNYVRQAEVTIRECYNKYRLDEVFLCFNGGKDCTVLLHLTLHILHKMGVTNQQLLCMYVQSPNPFPEVDLFIQQCKQYYNFKLVHIRAGIKEALGKVLNEHLQLKACLMGTRRTDPFSASLKVFQMTDTDWPQVMRVNPLLDWSFTQIWEYLRLQNVPYCSLYDVGYTSLGSQINTCPNPALKNPDSEKEDYLPAYKLLDGSKERDGRVMLKKQ